jgi:hypothetical protein
LNKATWEARIKAVEHGLDLSRYKDKGPLPRFPFPHIAFIRTGAGFVEGTMETAFSHMDIQMVLDLFAFAPKGSTFEAWSNAIRQRFEHAGFGRAAEYLLADLTSIPSIDERIHLMGRINIIFWENSFKNLQMSCLCPFEAPLLSVALGF